MLRHTFCHLPGIGSRTEMALWQAGITTWEDLLTRKSIPGRSASRASCADHLHDSIRHYAAQNSSYFAGRLPSSQQWRLFHDFRGSCAYLDIETTGLSPYEDQVTTIALYAGRRVRTYVRDENLDAFPEDVQDFGLLVTYNGASFDLPFLQRQFGITFRQAHIDLRYVLASLGVRGGLKNCERQLGVGRHGLGDVDGYVAVLLWQEYRRSGRQEALETLLAYNAQDVLNLEGLMVEAYNRKLSGTPFTQKRLAAPDTPANPFTPDPVVIRRFLGLAPWQLSVGRV
jgi:uncharacterized protein YprB with RNaseH-like and TPR domain